MSLEPNIEDRLLSSTLERGFAGAGLTLIAGVCALVALFNPSSTHLLPACPLLSITGFACPGCGLTRGFHALFHGDYLAALDFNALIPFYVIGAFYIVITLGLVVIRGRGLSLKLLNPYALFGFLFISIVFGVLRNIPEYPFSVLFP